MYCSTGEVHTVTISDDGTLFAFGSNGNGQLGLGSKCNDVLVPRCIPHLPKIKVVSCGSFYTVCVDYEGSMWSFGSNENGQLGTGNKISHKLPQKIGDLPPIHSVSCGRAHTLMLTNSKDLWSCGNNDYGQLCTLSVRNQSKPQKTRFSCISIISTGDNYSIFRNNKGEIFVCGQNDKGQLGLGSRSTHQIKPLLLRKAFVQICSGKNHSLYLDSNGNVFSVGHNANGQLGNGNTTNQYSLGKISRIPPIQMISCAGNSSYLLDFDGNLWSFGANSGGQLGQGDRNTYYYPKTIPFIKNIKQISYGSSSNHVLVKDSESNIYIMGSNNYGQLGGTEEFYIAPQILHVNNAIWCQKNHSTELINERDSLPSMCSEFTMKWKDEEIEKIKNLQLKIHDVKLTVNSSNNKIKQEFPKNSFETWNEVKEFINEKCQQINSKLNQKQEKQIKMNKTISVLEEELNDIENTIQQLQTKKEQILENLKTKKHDQETFETNFQKIKYTKQMLDEMCSNVAIFCENENEMNRDIEQLFIQKKFENFDCNDISKLLWKMDLVKYQQVFEDNQINGELALIMTNDWTPWKEIVPEKRDYFYILFNFEMMKTSGYKKTLSRDYSSDCSVCSHNTPEKTIYLLKEYDIPIDDDLILKNNYVAPVLFPLLNDILGNDFLSPTGRKIITEVNKWEKLHKEHLKDLSTLKRKLDFPEEGNPQKKQKLTHE